ncbi:hypothetical protein S7711_05186 [Stachybotrys chartarum IBT 7711]|uniref:Chromo domain-containing protein n=1 Tax=Stachybotrys chartarum (strain CBS 109288 / IBT 7711) TaxID=1280523 RepID=A0A084ANF2_STACB|nr:hypothetical protein S7711_05186 [Stachybotrys chartarum IBT 7711]KFA76824.1 hypothetical protein S40288_03047 [Stachybotrys chartarum IBT 40288]
MARQRHPAKTFAAISESETSDVEEVTVPVRNARNSRSARATQDNSPAVDDAVDEEGDVVEGDEGDEGGDEEDEEDDVFVVEAIKKHMIDEDGSLKFQVKWEGYDSKKDLTWEPEENLQDSAQEILTEYFARIGGRQAIFDETDKALKTKKRGRSTGGGGPSVDSVKRSRKNGVHPADTTPPATTTKKWSPPAGSWEDEIESIDACEDGGSGKLTVYLIWKNGQKTKHDTSVIYKKCPQKMLQYYERHVKIIRDEVKTLTEGAEAA